MARHDDGYYLSKVWCCLTCYWKGAAGSMNFTTDEDGPGLACPRCESARIHPTCDTIIHLPAYVGEIGTVH
jgi:hypothetical protein